MYKLQRIRYLIILAVFSIAALSCNSPGKKASGTSENLRIITYNVWYGFTEVPERKMAWIEWMKEQDPDIVALQELNEYTERKLADDAESYGHPYSVLLKEDGFPTGITSRYPIEDVRRIKEGFHHGLIRVRIKGIYFYVIHLHPSNWETRKAEIKQILDDIKDLPSGSEIILAGDFNTFSPLDSIYYSHGRLEPFFNERDIRYGEKNLNHGKLDYSVIRNVLDFGLIDLEASRRNSSYIFTGSFPTKIEKEGEHGDLRRLDYIFASKNLAGKVKSARIIASDTTLILSDHLPVVVDLALNQARQAKEMDTLSGANHSLIKRIKATDGLIAFWKFDEEPGQKRKASGQDLFPLEEAGGEIARINEGPVSGYSMQLDGRGFLTLPNEQTGALNIHGEGEEVSVIAWVKWLGKQTGFVGGMWNEYQDGGKRQYGLFISLPYYNGADQVCGHISRSGKPTPPFPYSIDYSASSQKVPVNEWCCIAFTYDGEYIRSYLNGTFEPREAELIHHTKGFTGYEEGLIQTKNPYYFPHGMGNNGSDFTVGAVLLKNGMGNYFQGLIGGLAIFDRALREDELSGLVR